MLKLVTTKSLRDQGVLGINQRNADYIMRYNSRALYPLVDDKIKTKSIANEAGIEVPKLYATINTNHEISRIENLLDEFHDVVIKPAHGSGGNGILVIGDKVGKFFQTPSGNLISLNAVKHYVTNILSGMYSLGGLPDKAFLEYRVNFDPVFNHISFKGVPDIRIIVFQCIPIAAMLRLPTSKSEGKGNLHQGAIGVGVDLKSGRTKYGVNGNTITSTHPDTGYSINDIQIPQWDKILKIAIKCADTVGLGYLGVDIVLDRELGPLMLELNARPGLNVQLANQQGLHKKLSALEQLTAIPTDFHQRMLLAQSLPS